MELVLEINFYLLINFFKELQEVLEKTKSSSARYVCYQFTIVPLPPSFPTKGIQATIERNLLLTCVEPLIR